MSVPEPVRERLHDEQVEAAVSLGDDDALVITRTRTLRYRSEGLISDASVAEHAHDAEAISLSEGRRKATIHLDYGVDGAGEVSVPVSALGDVLPPLLSAVLRTNGVLEAGEAIEEVYRLGELTIIVAGGRVVKHVGDALWDVDAAEYDYDDVTGLDVEEGSVSSQLIVEVGGRPQWIKLPSDRARGIRERIESALLSHHGAASYREFERRQGDDGSSTGSGSDAGGGSEETTDPGDASGGSDTGVARLDFGGDVGGVVDAGSGASGDVEDLAAEVADLREAVERQGERIETQQRTIERLIEELRRR